MTNPISLKMFVDASPVGNESKGEVTLAVNTAGTLRPLLTQGRPLKEEVKARTFQAFTDALKKDFGSHVTTLVSEQFKADFASNRPLTARLVQQMVHSAKELIAFNAMVRNSFIMQDHTGESGFSKAFEARLDQMQEKIHPELKKEIKNRLMNEFLQHFQSKNTRTFTVEAMQRYVAHESSLMNAVETVCAKGEPVPSFASGNSILEARLDPQGMLMLREAPPPVNLNEPVLCDPSPGITDAKKAFAHFVRTTPLFSGFSPAHVKLLKTALTTEFKTHLNACKDATEARHMLTKFANNKLASQTLDMLANIAANPCRGFAGSLDDKLDIARALFRPEGETLGMHVAMEHLADIRKMTPQGPLTKGAIWKGIFNEAMPSSAKVSFAEAFGQKLLSFKLNTTLPGRTISLMHNLIRSDDIPTLLNNPHLPVTEKNLHTCEGLSSNTPYTDTNALANDLYRRGGNGDIAPSTISIGDTVLTIGSQPKIGDLPFPFSAPEGLQRYGEGKNTEVAEYISETLKNFIGRQEHSAQQEMVQALCTQGGLLPLTRMRKNLGLRINEHSPSNITIDKADTGAVRVRIATPKVSRGSDFEAQNGSIDVTWLVEPDGKLNMEKLTIVRPGKDAEQRPAERPAVEAVVQNRIAAQAAGLSEKTRTELANLVIASVKSKPGDLADPMNPGAHPGPLMRLLDGVRSGLFTGPNADDTYATLRRFPSDILPLGLLLDAAKEARAEQPQGEISRESLWAKMYPDFEFIPCGTDAEMVRHMENALPKFVHSQAEMIVFAKSKAIRERGQAALSDAQIDTDTRDLAKRLMLALSIMPAAVATKFVAQPRALHKEDLLAPNMAAYPGFQYDARAQLAKDINRRGMLDKGIPTLNINKTSFTLGVEPKKGAEKIFTDPAELAVYKSGKPTKFVRELMGEIRSLCGGQNASQQQVDTVARCCAQCGSTAFRTLSAAADLKFDEHSSTNIAVSAGPDGMVRVHISTLEEQASRGNIAYTILVDRNGNTSVDDFTARPANVA